MLNNAVEKIKTAPAHIHRFGYLTRKYSKSHSHYGCFALLFLQSETFCCILFLILFDFLLQKRQF